LTLVRDRTNAIRPSANAILAQFQMVRLRDRVLKSDM
jgi:hypothetical protein